MRRRGHMEVEFIADKKEIVKTLLPKLKVGEIVLTLGAGDVDRVGEELVEALQG